MTILLVTLCLLIILVLAAMVLSKSATAGAWRGWRRMPIYCLMVTGKDASRQAFAQAAVHDFMRQTYPNKKLVIVNHGSYDVIPPPMATAYYKTHGVAEFHIEKGDNVTLGDLRNMALQFVPPGACWFTWDDDDVRHPRLLQWLYNAMMQQHADAVAFTRRLEYNLTNGGVWMACLQRGFVHMLVANDSRIKYLSRDTLEDIELAATFKRLGKRLALMQDNDPTMYVRLVHGSNTSPFVNPDKSGASETTQPSANVSYSEHAANDSQKKFATRAVAFMATRSHTAKQLAS